MTPAIDKEALLRIHTFVGGDAPANERRAAAEANRFRKP